MTPPRVASWLLEAALPQSLGEAIAGDLYEEFCAYAVPRRGVFLARWWYRWQVARSLAPLFFRSWQRASVLRASAAIGGAGLIAVGPATVLMMLRLFVLQQVPLKTTGEFGVGFGMLLAGVVIVTAAAGVAAAARIMAGGRRR